VRQFHHGAEWDVPQVRHVREHDGVLVSGKCWFQPGKPHGRTFFQLCLNYGDGLLIPLFGMSIAATSVRFDDASMWVELSDGRTIGVPFVGQPGSC
jgi:hypothetical protein